MTIIGSILGFFGGASSIRDYPAGNPAKLPSANQYYGEWGRNDRVAGTTVNSDTATTISAIYRAVSLISSTIAGFPLHVYEKQGDGSRVSVEYAQDHYLWSRPNPEVSAFTFWETVLGHETLDGNAYLWVEDRPGVNPIVALWPILPERMRVGRDTDGRKIYLIDGGIPARDWIDGGNIVHVAGWGRNGLVGVSVVRQMMATIGLAMAAEASANSTFENGVSLSGVLSTDAVITTEEAREMAARWETAHSGHKNAGKAAVLGNGLKWTPSSMTLEDAQMLETRSFQVSEVARWFGIPEFLLNAHDKTSSWGTGLEINNRAFVQYTLMSHMLRFQQTITDELLNGLVTRRYVKFNPDALLMGTTADRIQTYKDGSAIGLYTINDMLALEDRPGIGPDGDLRYVPLNMGVVGQPPPPVG